MPRLTHGIMKNLTQVYKALRADCGFATQKSRYHKRSRCDFQILDA
jgi:hypothetical protein